MAMTKEQKAAYNKAYSQANKEAIASNRKTNITKVKLQVKLASIKRKYNLTADQYNDMFIDQGNCCAICDEIMLKPCIDHNHTTGKVRELLCDPCNVGFARFKEDPRLLEKAAMYARFHNGEKNKV